MKARETVDEITMQEDLANGIMEENDCFLGGTIPPIISKSALVHGV